MLVLATLAVAATVLIAAPSVRLPLVLPGAAALSAYMLFWAASAKVAYVEPFAGGVAVLCAGAAATFAVRRTDLALWAAVALAVAAASLRELLGYLPLAGAASVALVRAQGWRRRLVPWAVGCAAVVAIYTAHLLSASRYVVPRAVGGSFLRGGPSFLVDGVSYGTVYFGARTWLPFVVAALGVAGAALFADTELRAFCLASTLVPLGLFLVAGNGATSTMNGESINYWGGIVMPMLCALLPVAFAVIPSMRAEKDERLR
jgi:hypothetical protein